MASLKGKVVVITGASAGIGAACAVKFAKRGARLVLHGRNEGNLKKVVDLCVAEGVSRDDIVMTLGELAEDNSTTVELIIKNTLDKFGTIHVLVNNAGFLSPKEGALSVNGNVESFDEMYRITLRTPYLLAQGFAAQLIKNKGAIVTVCSAYSHVADPAMTSYATMKAGMDHFTKILSIELAPKGVRVNNVNPGYVKTSIGRLFGDAADAFWESRCPMTPLEQKLSEPEDIANVVVFVASDDASAMTGSVVNCDRATSLTNRVVDFTQYQ